MPAICQDDDGFLWFSTKNGLNRYDGYQFQVFKNDPFDSLSLGDNELVDVQASGYAPLTKRAVLAKAGSLRP